MNRPLNAIQYFTRNKHSDYPEVVFSSILSNLLDPEVELVFREELIHYLFDVCFGEDLYLKQKNLRLKSEAPLGNAGSIDCLISSDEVVLGIEVKIWDRSAKNIDKDGTPQLIRYANELKKRNDQWRLLFVVPTADSKVCIEEFTKAYYLYPDKILLLSWNDYDRSNIETIKGIFDLSLNEILMDLKPKVQEDPISRWIYNSLIEEIPKLKKAIPDQSKFPNAADLRKNKDLWLIFNDIFHRTKTRPSPIHSTVGIPYGRGVNKFPLHGNSLYRVRTTKDYYSSMNDKEKYLPENYVEIEIWIDVFQEIENELKDFVDKYSLEIVDSKHLDSEKKIGVKILKILPSSYLLDVDTFFAEFDRIMRKGYDLANLPKAGNNAPSRLCEFQR